MAIELRDVTVMAGRARLIEGVSLTVEPGVLTVILGANGAGKSTTLAVMAGDTRPAEGAALLDGEPLASFTPEALAARRAVVLQHAPINFAMQVHEVVALSRASGQDSGGEGDRIDQEALEHLELMPLAARDYSTLSGGERQRVQIARALAQLWHRSEPSRPGHLLMDEPTAHLDLKHQILALEVAQGFARAGGAALCILHDIGLAREFAGRVVLMKRGRIVAQGAPDALITAAAIADIYDISDQRARRFAAV